MNVGKRSNRQVRSTAKGVPYSLLRFCKKRSFQLVKDSSPWYRWNRNFQIANPLGPPAFVWPSQAFLKRKEPCRKSF
jgi:hypothetical protein